jgi:glyoxylase-like metal-dependent hydrolase (beta-lactamase superfamily II)
MRRCPRSAILFLICYSVFILAENALGQNVVAQNPVGQTRALPTASDQNSILNLYDAFGYQKRGTVLDWGFSALVHYNGKTILFDTGNNADSFEHNVKALGVDLNQVDIAVLSRRHFDHISGFDYVLKIKPTVKAYLPADPALGAPFHYTISKDTKESLAGLPPEQLYFGGGVNSMDYKPGVRFHGGERRVRRREPRDGSRRLLDRDWVDDDGRLQCVSTARARTSRPCRLPGTIAGAEDGERDRAAHGMLAQYGRRDRPRDQGVSRHQH